MSDARVVVIVGPVHKVKTRWQYEVIEDGQLTVQQQLSKEKAVESRTATLIGLRLTPQLIDVREPMTLDEFTLLKGVYARKG